MADTPLQLIKHPEKEAIRVAFVQQVQDLDNIIANIDGANATQTRAAIKKLAHGQKRILRLVKNLLT